VTLRGLLRVTVGAVLGGATALMAVWLDADDQGVAFTVLVVLAISFVGLSMGSNPAIAAYLVAAAVLIGSSVLQADSLITNSDLIRLAAFALGTPVVIALAIRAERRQVAAERAQETSQAAEVLANARRREADAARRDLDAALADASRERTRLEEVAEAIPEALIVYDGDARGTYGNRAALRVFGRSFFESSVETWARAADPRDERARSLPREEWPQLRGAREAFRSRMLVRLPMSGRDLLVDVEGTPIPGGGCVLLLRDVGKEVDARRRLSRFASFVAHELRNPLAVAKARMELANRQAGAQDSTHGLRALESVDAAIGILERLELFSRAESGNLEADSERFDVRSAVDSAIERLRARGSERDVRVTANGPNEVVGDRALTEQAITNLLTNADRYSTPDAPIEVDVDTRDVPSVRVRDAGPGFPDELTEDLFRERVTSGRGLGLGLYIVNAAMRAQGGSVQLEERRPRASLVLRWPRAADRRSE
jgi:signal transduction histidine kinase